MRGRYNQCNPLRWLLLTGMTITVIPARADPPLGAVEIWIRAFIPNPASAGTAASYIFPRPGSPAQSLVRLIPSNQHPGPDCFVTDNRGFASSPGGTARAETRFTLSMSGNGGQVTPSNGRTTAAATVRANCTTGAQMAMAPGSVVRDVIGTPTAADGTVQVVGQVTAKNELAAGGWGPSIDYSFDLQWTPGARRLRMAANYGSFPAFEVYARVQGGSWQTVIRHAPTGNPWNLALDGFGISFERDVQTVIFANN